MKKNWDPVKSREQVVYFKAGDWVGAVGFSKVMDTGTKLRKGVGQKGFQGGHSLFA